MATQTCAITVIADSSERSMLAGALQISLGRGSGRGQNTKATIDFRHRDPYFSGEDEGTVLLCSLALLGHFSLKDLKVDIVSPSV